ncbi:unnamed protein product [Pedinophyceae sp. YPF-701]|nr:unnamed protein product [Pedinophyceae sp. YPF-701]
MNYSVWYLGARQRSAAWMERRLVERGHARDVAQRAVRRLEELDLLNDEAYAENFVRSKWRQSLWAPRRIADRAVRQELLARAVVDEATDKYFGARPFESLSHPESWREVLQEARVPASVAPLVPHHAEDEQDVGFSRSRELLEGAQARARLTGGMARDTRRRRLASWLQARGHDWGVVSAVMRVLDL